MKGDRLPAGDRPVKFLAKYLDGAGTVSRWQGPTTTRLFELREEAQCLASARAASASPIA